MIRSHTDLRWQRWQDSPVSRRYLSPEGLTAGYTLLRVPPQSRDAFFTLAEVLLARAQFEQQLARLLAQHTPLSTWHEAQHAWEQWQTWSRRLAAYLTRMAAGKDGTLPPVPEALQPLLTLLEGHTDA